MSFSELTKMAVDRIRNVEQENFRKIMGFILFSEPSEKEMMQLAYGPDSTFITRILEVKAMLKSLSPENASVSSLQQFGSSPSAFYIPSEHRIASNHLPIVQNIDFDPQTYSDSTKEELLVTDQQQFFNSDQNLCSQDVSLSPLRTSRRAPSLPELPIKPCHYYYKGYCKHGVNCRYYHGSPFFHDPAQPFGPSLNELQGDEHNLPPGSLEKLEMEITELLRPRRGVPVSIAALPMLYYDKYGKNLQADGYLTESQRHGKAGFSLTKLLARLKNSIRLIDRPHGQHSVVLMEAVPQYLDCRNERNESGMTSSSSHQIYLTFPAESTFTEDDVSNYFNQFGPVQDVRIPCQEKRMFGFVCFVYPETVNEILMKRVPHYISGARVLVKPYREKSRMVDRIHNEHIKSAMYPPPHYTDFESDLQALPDEFPLEDNFNYTFEALNIGLSANNKTRKTSNGFRRLERGEIVLPDNPFVPTPLLENSVSTVV